MDQTVLRAALMRLRTIPIDRAAPMAEMTPQEMLDVLAMMAGIKPVYLLGKGYGDPAWVAGVLEFASHAGLHIVQGPAWNVASEPAALPEWFRDYIAAEQQSNIFYLCRDHRTADAVRAAIASSPISVEEEARLLDYPPCCVGARYERDALFDLAFYKVLERNGQSDIVAMKCLLDEDADMSPETQEEEALLDDAMRIVRAPFISVNMCGSCASDSDSPARKLSKQYGELMRFVDQSFAEQMAR